MSWSYFAGDDARNMKRNDAGNESRNEFRNSAGLRLRLKLGTRSRSRSGSRLEHGLRSSRRHGGGDNGGHDERHKKRNGKRSEPGQDAERRARTKAEAKDSGNHGFKGVSAEPRHEAASRPGREFAGGSDQFAVEDGRKGASGGVPKAGMIRIRIIDREAAIGSNCLRFDALGLRLPK